MKNITVIILLLLCATPGVASVQVYLNDYPGFLAVSGAMHVIDFETLPDGQPTHPSVPITSSFNYDLQGAHFSVPLGQLGTTGNNLSHDPLRDFAIAVIVQPLQRTWITADLITPSTAIGIFFPGDTSVFCYSATGTLLAQPILGGGGDQFIGVTSNTPIARVVVDRQANVSAMSAFLYAPVPEPATLALLAISFAVLRGTPRRRL